MREIKCKGKCKAKDLLEAIREAWEKQNKELVK